MNEIIESPPLGDQPPGRRRRRMLAAGGLLAAGTLTGSILASTVSASAATPTAGTSTSGQSSGSSSSGQVAASGHGGATPVRSDEKVVPASVAATLRAAALAVVPGGTVYRIETDAGDGVYEAHMTKADGTLVTVKFNKNLVVTKVESGMGQGDAALTGQPAGAGGPGGSGTGGPSA